MTLFEFLERISKEDFGLQLRHAGSTVEVHVDALYEKWVVAFDRNGFASYTRYREAETDAEAPDGLDGLFDRPRRAWEEAAEDLGIRFVGRYRFSVGASEHCVTGLLPDFGWGKGTLVVTRQDSEGASQMTELATEYTRAI